MSLAALADEDLMQLVRRGDTAAFEVVYERHATAAFSLAYRMTAKRNTAEDVVQEAFLSLWRSGARTEVEAARRDEAREVRSALRALPAEQSRVIELAYFGGFSQSEIAAMLDTPIGTIKGRMRLGLQKMRGELNGLAEAPA